MTAPEKEKSSTGMRIRPTSAIVKYTLIFLLITVLVFPALANEKGNRLLFGEEYFHALHKAFQEAKDSIWVQMYYMSTKDAAPNDPVTVLINDLQDAKKRGVDVRVILEDRLFDNNYNAYNSLTQAGIDVYLDSPVTLLHSKAALIDKKILIFGSANWSYSAFYSNNEVSVLLESPQLAAQLAEEFKNIKLSREPAAEPFQYNGVKIPKRLLTDKFKLPLLFTRSSEKAFDLYLLLFKESESLNSATLALDYEKLARQMHYKITSRDTPLKQTYAKFFYFFNVYQPLKKLTRTYKLLERQPWSKTVTILDFSPKNSDWFILPFEYWDYGLDKQLSFNAKIIWLVALLEASESKHNPYWFRPQKGLAQKYHIGERSISQGILELEREELLEVYRHIPRDPRHPEKRPANDYRLNPLISTSDFEKQASSLIQKYGVSLFNQAKGLSSQLGQPKDLNKIETFITLINKFGYKETRRAVSRARLKRLESGLRSLTYVISLLKPQIDTKGHL